MDILRYPDAKWNISGLFSHDAIVLKFWDIISQCCEFPVCGVHGSVPCKWNSGRTIVKHSDKYVDECVQEYLQRGISLFLTFSNYYIAENDLLDPFSNQLLDMISESPNSGVIIASPLLATYIKAKHPNMQLIMSVLASVNTSENRNRDYYVKATKNYFRVVIHPDDLFDTKLLSCIEPKDKFEIMVNENCLRNCSYRKVHDDLMSRFSLESTDEMFKSLADFSKEHCRMFINEKNLPEYLNGKAASCIFSHSHLDEVYKLGFRYFKIQGRADAPASFLYDLSKYILTEEAGTYVYKSICNMISFTEKKESLNLL